jgi:hypothetical protein
MSYEDIIKELLKDPEKLKLKKPFTRGVKGQYDLMPNTIMVGGKVMAELPSFELNTVTQDVYLSEYDPNSHKVLFDENIPKICVKLNKDGYQLQETRSMAVPFQQLIKNKKLLHLTANPTNFTLNSITPTEKQQENFAVIKQYWSKRNQDGMRTKMVDMQLTVAESGLLFYFNRKREIKSRVISYMDGYNIISHRDRNGEVLLECIHSYDSNRKCETLDCYDDTKHYVSYKEENGWSSWESELHGFSEIPLVSKRGKVAWDNVQTIIDDYETLFNIFNVTQKRYGWGILYVKGRFNDTGKKLAGSVILNDNGTDPNSDAKFLTPPTPSGIIDTLTLMEEAIQKGSSTTFILPKDVKSSGDVSARAIKLTQSMDLEEAKRGVIDWQNVADKMIRLFKEGLAKELVNKGINPNAITEFEDLDITASFSVWEPQNDYEYNQMLSIMVGSGILSKETAIELNTESKPDEKIRIERELEKEFQRESEEIETTEEKIGFIK